MPLSRRAPLVLETEVSGKFLGRANDAVIKALIYGNGKDEAGKPINSMLLARESGVLQLPALVAPQGYQ